MTPEPAATSNSPVVSIGIFAWNEEGSLQSTLRSLFEQSLFTELHQRGRACEVVCVANGCTDRTPEIAARLFQDLASQHPHRECLALRVVNIVERGKVNAWNQYVHQLSARSASILFMMDADIIIHGRETMANMLATLEADPEAAVAVDLPRKDIAHKKRKSLAERLSLGASRMTLAAEGQLCGQLYSIRAKTARSIYLPRDLAACEDGLIKILVCTDFLAHSPWSKRIRLAPGAEHTFEAYTTPRAVLKNQKRQIIGQTILHVLVDQFLSSHWSGDRDSLAAFLKAKDAEDPSWLKRLIREHLRNTRWAWRLYPGLVSNRFQRLRGLKALPGLACLPAAVAGCCATLTASLLAYRSLKAGSIDYWPKAQRAGFQTPAPTAEPRCLNHA
jgi:glycosyltransferase involved in cell wall biosynthesis